MRHTGPGSASSTRTSRATGRSIEFSGKAGGSLDHTRVEKARADSARVEKAHYSAASHGDSGHPGWPRPGPSRPAKTMTSLSESRVSTVELERDYLRSMFAEATLASHSNLYRLVTHPRHQSLNASVSTYAEVSARWHH